MMRALVIAPTFLLAACCMHGGMHEGGMQGEMMGMGGGMRERMERPWPIVRIDGPAGALVVMEQGVFGEGLNVRAPFQGSFQPTSSDPRGGYPLAFQLDTLAAQHYGAPAGTQIYARLMVRESEKPRGVLVLAPSECALKALINGDLDELRVTSEELPRADVACARAQDMHAAMQHQDAHPGMTHEDAHPGMPHAGGAAMCGHEEHSGCGQTTCGHGGHDRCLFGSRFDHGADATLILRTTKWK